MKIKVTRTFESITREIDNCAECPFCERYDDGHSTIHTCEHKEYGTGEYDNVISSNEVDFVKCIGVPKRCPLINNDKVKR